MSEDLNQKTYFFMWVQVTPTGLSGCNGHFQQYQLHFFQNVITREDREVRPQSIIFGVICLYNVSRCQLYLHFYLTSSTSSIRSLGFCICFGLFSYFSAKMSILKKRKKDDRSECSVRKGKKM